MLDNLKKSSTYSATISTSIFLTSLVHISNQLNTSTRWYLLGFPIAPISKYRNPPDTCQEAKENLTLALFTAGITTLTSHYSKEKPVISHPLKLISGVLISEALEMSKVIFTSKSSNVEENLKQVFINFGLISSCLILVSKPLTVFVGYLGYSFDKVSSSWWGINTLFFSALLSTFIKIDQKDEQDYKMELSKPVIWIF